MTAAERAIEEAGFQSLFWWIGLYDQSKGLGGETCIETSFNPCFGGSVSTTNRSLGDVLHDLLFQSLFWWIGLYDPHNLANTLERWTLFQSLFWWIGLYDLPGP